MTKISRMSIPRSTASSEEGEECERIVVTINLTGQYESDIEEGEIVEENLVENIENDNAEDSAEAEENSPESVASTDEANKESGENDSVNSPPEDDSEESPQQEPESLNELFIHESDDETCASSTKNTRTSTLSMVLRSATTRNKIVKDCQVAASSKVEGKQSTSCSYVRNSPIPFLPPPPFLVDRYPELSRIPKEEDSSDSESEEEKKEFKRRREVDRIEDVKQKRRRAINRIRGIGPYWHPYIEEDSDVEDYDEDEFEHSLMWGDAEDRIKRAEMNGHYNYPERNYEYIYGALYDSIRKVAADVDNNDNDGSAADKRATNSLGGRKRKLTLGEYYCTVPAAKRRLLESSSPSRTVLPLPDVPDYAIAAGVPSLRKSRQSSGNSDEIPADVVKRVDPVQETGENIEPEEKPEEVAVETPVEVAEEVSEEVPEEVTKVRTRKRKRDMDEDGEEGCVSKQPKNYMI